MENDSLREELSEKIEELDSQKEELTAAIEQLAKRNQQLTSSYNELEKRNNELDQLIYRTHHDLKAPIASLNGLFRLMEMDPQSITVYRDRLDDCTRQMTRIVRSLNFYARNVREEVEITQFNIEELLDNVLQDIMLDRPERNWIFNRKVKQESLIQTDVFRLELILTHIISNSINFQKPVKPTNRIDIFIKGDQEQTTIIIADQGIGIPKDVLKKAGTFFFRGSELSRGSGIGLYVVKTAVAKLKGSFDIKSKEGEGTEVTITIPNLPLTS